MTLVDMNLPRSLNMILDVIIQSGGRPILVGGCVRDHILGLSVKDFDIEVDLWSATNYKKLRADAINCERRNMLNPTKKKQKS